MRMLSAPLRSLLALLRNRQEQTIVELRDKIKENKALVLGWWRDIPVELLPDSALPADCDIVIED